MELLYGVDELRGIGHIADDLEVVVGRERGSDEEPVVRVVVGHQDTNGHTLLPSCNVKLISVPAASARGAAQMVPPWRSTMRRDTTRPTTAGSSTARGVRPSNIAAASGEVIRLPSSVTRTSTPPPSCSTCTVTVEAPARRMARS